MFVNSMPRKLSLVAEEGERGAEAWAYFTVSILFGRDADRDPGSGIRCLFDPSGIQDR
jgi:hypothetical protein